MQKSKKDDLPRKMKVNMPPLADNEPAQAVLQAIQQANYAAAGAPFAPLLIKVASPGLFDNIWTSERGDTPNAFWQFNNSAGDGFLPLGDQAAISGASFGSIPILLFQAMPGQSDALAHPTGFTWILDDAGSGNPNDIDYWWPIPPSGYSSVGIAISGSGAAPDTNNYWCVKNTLLQSAATQHVWSDAGQRWKHHNGDLSIPVLNTNQQTPGPNLLLAPTTFLSDEFTSDNGGNTSSFVLSLGKCLLPVSGASPPDPVYNPNNTTGTTTGMGVGNVAVMPCSVVRDPNSGITPVTSPFYYLAAEPYWYCEGSYSTPAGGNWQMSVGVGTSEQQSSSMETSTSITVGAEVGVEAGPASASVSVSYTQEMSVTESQSTEKSTEVTVTIGVTIPPAAITQFWQRVVGLAVFRTDGTTMTYADYANPDQRFTQSPTEGED